MAHVLKSLLTEKTLWRLLLRTALAVFAVLIVYYFGFNPLSVIVAAFVFGIIYFREIEEKRFFKTSFWLLPVLALTAMELVSLVVPIAVFTVLFFILLGLINLFFKERFLTYGVFNTAFLAGLSLFYFYIARGPENFWIFGIPLFAAIFLILKESLNFTGFPGEKRVNLHVGVLGFLGVEFSYVLQFLPLGFINAAVFLTLFLVLGRDAAASLVKGALNFSFMMKQIAFFVVLAIVVFAASGW